MNNQTMSFSCGWDYLDFAFYLDMVDPSKDLCNEGVELAYKQYTHLLSVCPSDCEDFRLYLQNAINSQHKGNKQMNTPQYMLKLEHAVKLLEGNNVPYDFICPHCLTLANMNNDGYQMNDIVETIFCSADCSYQFNLDHKNELLNKGYTEQDLKDLA